jgi:osmotically-inducible protein OsmY
MSMQPEGRPSPSDIERRMREALPSDGPDAARRLWVTTSGSRAMIHGSVSSSADLRTVKRAAASAPGVVHVVDLVEIRP